MSAGSKQKLRAVLAPSPLPEPLPGDTWIANDDGERVTVVKVDSPRTETSLVVLRSADGREFKYTLRSLWAYHRAPAVDPAPLLADVAKAADAVLAESSDAGDCVLCHAAMELDDGCEPTAICHHCAQKAARTLARFALRAAGVQVPE